MGSRIDHPEYYNAHPSGIECIDVIRHYQCDIAMAMKYLWRAGLKKEEGLTEVEKEVEDCKKAIWYIQDHIKQLESKPKNFNCCGLCVYCRVSAEGYLFCNRCGHLINVDDHNHCESFESRDGGK